MSTSQKSPPKVDPIFSAFFGNCCKNFPGKSAGGAIFFCVLHGRLIIPKRNARLLLGMCFGGAESQVPECVAKIVHFSRRVRRCRKPVCRARGKIFLHTFVSDGRLLAADEKIIRISSDATGPQAPKQDPFFGFFRPICVAWRLYCELYHLSVAGDRHTVEGVLTFKICIKHFLLANAVWGLDPQKCYFRACPVAKSHIL